MRSVKEPVLLKKYSHDDIPSEAKLSRRLASAASFLVAFAMVTIAWLIFGLVVANAIKVSQLSAFGIWTAYLFVTAILLVVTWRLAVYGDRTSQLLHYQYRQVQDGRIVRISITNRYEYNARATVTIEGDNRCGQPRSEIRSYTAPDWQEDVFVLDQRLPFLVSLAD